MKIKIIWVGKNREAWLKDALADYIARVRRYMPLELMEIKDEKGAGTEEMRRRECERISRHISPGSMVILLDERGEQMDSCALGSFIARQRDMGVGELVFVIGGAYGFTDEFRNGLKLLSFSKMTFTHQMIRLFLMEQIYRAFTIINGEPYHH